MKQDKRRMIPDPNYFTCTLGQAAVLKEAAASTASSTSTTSTTSTTSSTTCSTIPQLLAHKARKCPDIHAVGFIRPAISSNSAPFPASTSPRQRTTSSPPSPAISPPSQEWTTKILTFKQIHGGVQLVASQLRELLLLSFPLPLATGKDETGAEPHNAVAPLPPPPKSFVEKGDTVALICPSSAGFLFTWLGLIELGLSVLLIAPQCQPGAVAHLCGECGVRVLLYDEECARLAVEATAAAAKLIGAVRRRKGKGDGEEMGRDSVGVENGSGNGNGGVRAIRIPFSADESVFEFLGEKEEREKRLDGVRSVEGGDLGITESSVAYIHHTSGTSSGLPKPIPQTHRAAVGVLPCLPSSRKATFTTTPLYHGGIADLFRAWTSDALIWLFPGRDVSITAGTIINCLRAIDGGAGGGDDDNDEDGQASLRPAYFSSVPYVLQLLEENEAGLKYLKRMELVGVGGAALPADIGDRLVEQGVRLLTRFGSAECGFLLSSHRDYESDREWQYHRLPSEVKKFLKFEDREDGSGTHELIVLSGWPHMAKRNQDNGSFATGDLFEAHPTIENAWKYHSRADSQLTLLTGKKFDPAPVEDAISASSRLIEDTLIFGNGKPYPGVLLFRSTASRGLPDARFLDECRPAIEKLNSESQNHARIRDDMLVPMPFPGDGSQALEKSSKGTVLRSSAERKYKDIIEGAYVSKKEDGVIVEDGDVLEFISDIVRDVLKRGDVTAEDELFHAGLDSMTSIQIRQRLSKLLPVGSRDLPLTVVEDYGTIRRLSNFILSVRHQNQESFFQDEIQLMHDMVTKYSRFNIAKINGQPDDKLKPANDGECIVLTGATGALGSFLLQKLRQRKGIRRIYCLVRGASQSAAEERVSKALKQKGFPSLSLKDEDKHVIVLKSTLGHTTLGLDEDVYKELTREATVYMHLAWAVNFRMRLRNFERDHINGLHNLLSAALASTRQQAPSFIFCSSVASVMNGQFADGIPECIIDDPSAASPIGYSKSKWVAEQICHNVNRDFPRMRGRIAVFRVGQLSGDSERGIWNTQEAWPMMLSSVKATKALPVLQGEPLSWLPVDVAADAFLDALDVLSNSDAGTSDEDEACETRVYHVVNEHKEPRWMDLLGWLEEFGEDFEVLEVREWLRRLEELERSGIDHPALRLLGHWKDAYGDDAAGGPGREGKRGRGKGGEEGEEEARFQMETTKLALPSLRNGGEVDKAYFGKLWEYIKSSA